MINLKSSACLLFASVFAVSGPATISGQELSIHGSGTTNPSKCFWHIMDKIEEQIKFTSRLTYRAVGSSTGIAEFVGQNNTGIDSYVPFNDFGAGDIPVPQNIWQAMNDKDIGFVQLPFVLSAVGFFHNIPGVPSGESGLNMTACLLARVFDRDIQTWDHADIKAINPGLNVQKDYPIFVARRVLGSSSTYSITNYLHKQCPRNSENPKGWPLEKVGAKIEWADGTNECDGSGPMTDCIVSNEGAIGYIDSAHGHEEDLNEIKLKNGDGIFLTSKEAGKEGVAAAALDLSDVPQSADSDFSKVEFYNMPGPNTWPITLVSYVYIRKNLSSFITSVERRTLLKAFAQTLFDSDYIGLCSRYGLIPVPSELRQISLGGIAMLETDDDFDNHKWFFEKNTMVGDGQRDYIISERRESFTLYEADRLAGDVAAMEAEVQQLKIELASVRAQLSETSGVTGAYHVLLAFITTLSVSIFAAFSIF